MFDLTCSHGRAGAFLDCTCAQSSCENSGVIVWEEHCIECGQPYCFKTCKMYERAFDGKCKRFRNGIVRTANGYACEFKKWGKLEGVFTGRIWSESFQGLFVFFDRILSRCCQWLNRLMAFVPGRIGAITVYRRLKKWVFEYGPGDQGNVIDCLLANIWADRPVDLHFSVIVGERNVFDDVLSLRNEWNEFHVRLPEVGKGARCLLFSTEEEAFKLVIARLDLVRDAGAARTDQGNVRPVKDPAKFVKCVAWDLDNTLWKGTLVEDGADRLVLNEDAVRLIKELDRRGIVHTVVSKNDYEPAWSALKRFGMDEYFIFPHINWLPKSGNLQSTAKEINIGLNTFAFIDDSPFERGEVGEKCVGVRIYNAMEISTLAERPEFNPPVSAESAKRRFSYQKEMQRVAAANAFQGDYDEFLRSCKIELKMFDLRKASEDEYQRCYELIQRTNQLTLAGHRYSEDEFKGLVGRPNMQAFGIRCLDRFGDYGIVGAVLFSVAKSNAKVEEFVMSCRVAKKKCEEATIRWLASRVRQSGMSELEADVVLTGRNAALVSAFDMIVGMRGERFDKKIRYRMDLAGLATMKSIADVVEV